MDLSKEQLDEFLKKINRDDFAAQINTKFQVNQNFEVELRDVSDVKKHPRQESFSLLFLMPPEFPPEQGIYLFEHPKLGANEIFVVPIERKKEGIIFEAVFNRILPGNQD